MNEENNIVFYSDSESDLKGKKIWYRLLKHFKPEAQIEFLPDKNRVDCFVSLPNGPKMSVELKYRGGTYPSTGWGIQNEGCLLEEIKMDALTESLRTGNCSAAYYVMIFPDNVMFIFDIAMIWLKHTNELILKEKKCPKTSEFANNTKKTKLVYFLKTDWASAKINLGDYGIHYENV